MVSLGTTFYPGVYDTYNMNMRELFFAAAAVVFFGAFLLVRKKGTVADVKDDLRPGEIIAFFLSLLVGVALLVGAYYYKVVANNVPPRIEGNVASTGETSQVHTGWPTSLAKETKVTLDDGTDFYLLSPIDKEDPSLPAGTRALFECDGGDLEHVEKCILIKKVGH